MPGRAWELEVNAKGIENEQGELLNFKIVGPDEIYDTKQYVSIDSPMARAMLKKKSTMTSWSKRRKAKKSGLLMK
ncbi:GreA/GreB family elongation factor [Psychromonas sp. PT13]|uniref:GreA/GreB family elongation factor n=1 Tax=Psychromonas sp. PT13 TaxID=3439547 RepID=UPI003EBCFE36